MKTYILVLFALFYFQSFGQTGTISIRIGEEIPIDSIDAKIILSRNDSVVREVIYKDDCCYTLLDSLPVGVYKLAIQKTHYIDMSYENITILENDKLSIYCSIERTTSAQLKDISRDSSMYSYGSEDLAFSFQSFNNNLFNTDDIVQSVYSFGIKSTFLEYPYKRVGFGVTVGSTISSCLLKKNQVYNFTEPVEKEKYFYWKASLGPTMRLFITKPPNKYGVFIDLSAFYNLPIRFRYVALDGNTKILDKSIHQFTDFSAFMRLGINDRLSFTAEYRLSNFLKSNYPEMPKIQLGIDLLIEN